MRGTSFLIRDWVGCTTGTIGLPYPKQRLVVKTPRVPSILIYTGLQRGFPGTGPQRRSILTAADVEQAAIDLEHFVAQAVDTETSVVSAGQSLPTARALQELKENFLFAFLRDQCLERGDYFVPPGHHAV